MQTRIPMYIFRLLIYVLLAFVFSEIILQPKNYDTRGIIGYTRGAFVVLTLVIGAEIAIGLVRELRSRD